MVLAAATETNADRHPAAFGLTDQSLYESHQAVTKVYLGVGINSKNELARAGAGNVCVHEQSASDQRASRHPLIVAAGPDCNHRLSNASRRSLDDGDPTDDSTRKLRRELSVTLSDSHGLVAFVQGQVGAERGCAILDRD